MKKTLVVITFALSSAFAIANAQTEELVAGWSFRSIVASSNPQAVAADASDLIADANVGSNIGFFRFDAIVGGTLSDAFAAGGAGALYNTIPGGIFNATDITTRPSSLDFSSNDDLLRIDNIVFGPVNVGFDIIIDTADLGVLGFEDWRVNFGAGSDGDLTINWEASFDGGAFTSVGSTAIVGGGNAAYGFSFADAASSVVLRGTYADFGDNEVLDIDNFAIYGTQVVPEPSTYAAIVGALALGFVAYRRRK